MTDRFLTLPEIRRAAKRLLPPGAWAWPLPGVWLGVSVEDQAHAELRVPALLETPAALRWVSQSPSNPAARDSPTSIGRCS